MTVCQPYRGQDGGAFGAARALFRMHLVGYFEGIDSERGLGSGFSKVPLKVRSVTLPAHH